MSADHICSYRDLWAFISSWPILPSPSFRGLSNTCGRGGGTISDPLCQSYPLYFLCFRYSFSFFWAEPHFQVFWSLQQFTSSSPQPSIYLFPILLMLIIQFHLYASSLRVTYTSCSPTVFLFCLVALLSSLDCAMLCGRVKARPLLISWKILALTRILDGDIW